MVYCCNQMSDNHSCYILLVFWLHHGKKRFVAQHDIPVAALMGFPFLFESEYEEPVWKGSNKK